MFRNIPEDHFEAILCVPILCASKVVGVITLQHRNPYEHSPPNVRLLSMIGFLVGAEIERARFEDENVELSDRLETRITIDRAKAFSIEISLSMRAKHIACCSAKAGNGVNRCEKSPRLSCSATS